MVLKSSAELLSSAMLVALAEEVVILEFGPLVGHHPLRFSYSVVSCTSMVHLISFLLAMTDTIR